jgi:hypothetical protein
VIIKVSNRYSITIKIVGRDVIEYILKSHSLVSIRVGPLRVLFFDVIITLRLKIIKELNNVKIRGLFIEIVRLLFEASLTI